MTVAVAAMPAMPAMPAPPARPPRYRRLAPGDRMAARAPKLDKTPPRPTPETSAQLGKLLCNCQTAAGNDGFNCGPPVETGPRIESAQPGFTPAA